MRALPTLLIIYAHRLVFIDNYKVSAALFRSKLLFLNLPLFSFLFKSAHTVSIWAISFLTLTVKRMYIDQNKISHPTIRVFSVTFTAYGLFSPKVLMWLVSKPLFWQSVMIGLLFIECLLSVDASREWIVCNILIVNLYFVIFILCSVSISTYHLLKLLFSLLYTQCMSLISVTVYIMMQLHNFSTFALCCMKLQWQGEWAYLCSVEFRVQCQS